MTVKLIVERVGSKANQPGRLRMVLGVLEAPSLRAAREREIAMSPGTAQATTALVLSSGEVVHCYRDQYFAYRSYARAPKADQLLADGVPS